LSDQFEEDDANVLSSEPQRRQRVSTTTSSHGAGEQERRHGDAGPGPLGLNVVYVPEAGKRKADIVFIHGLGGTSRFTWSKNKNPDLFWPVKFLPLDRDVSQARILSFGYNASFQRRGKGQVSISDFAKELLFDLKFATDENQDSLEIGSVSRCV
jgi:hypothetical protein